MWYLLFTPLVRVRHDSLMWSGRVDMTLPLTYMRPLMGRLVVSEMMTCLRPTFSMLCLPCWP